MASLKLLLLYNCFVWQQHEASGVHYSKVRGTRLPVYIGLNIHAWTRKRKVIDTMFDLGLSVSYDRVLEISGVIGDRVCEQYHCDAVVCPPNLMFVYNSSSR